MTLIKRLGTAAKSALKVALKTTAWLLRLMIPISLGVTMLDFFGILSWMAGMLNPAFHWLGLSGQCALVFITSIFLNIYSAIAVITSLTLSMREITILAVMCLISHNMIVEVMILQKTGSKAWKMTLLRLSSSLVAALMLNYLLPAESSAIMGKASSALSTPHNAGALQTVLTAWSIRAFWLSLKVALFVTGLMMLQKWMEELGIIEWLSKILSPLLKLMGLPAKSSFVWIVANVLGLGYSAAIMFEYHDSGRITRTENNIVNHHIAICHSLFEDTLLFMAIGVSGWWIIWPRLLLAIVVVWSLRAILYWQKEGLTPAGRFVTKRRSG